MAEDAVWDPLFHFRPEFYAGGRNWPPYRRSGERCVLFLVRCACIISLDNPPRSATHLLAELVRPCNGESAAFIAQDEVAPLQPRHQDKYQARLLAFDVFPLLPPLVLLWGYAQFIAPDAYTTVGRADSTGLRLRSGLDGGFLDPASALWVGCAGDGAIFAPYPTITAERTECECGLGCLPHCGLCCRADVAGSRPDFGTDNCQENTGAIGAG